MSEVRESCAHKEQYDRREERVSKKSMSDRCAQSVGHSGGVGLLGEKVNESSHFSSESMMQVIGNSMSDSKTCETEKALLD